MVCLPLDQLTMDGLLTADNIAAGDSRPVEVGGDGDRAAGRHQRRAIKAVGNLVQHGEALVGQQWLVVDRRRVQGAIDIVQAP